MTTAINILIRRETDIPTTAEVIRTDVFPGLQKRPAQDYVSITPKKQLRKPGYLPVSGMDRIVSKKTETPFSPLHRDILFSQATKL